MNPILKKIPSPLKGELIERKEPCRMCESKTGEKIGEVDFWDIKNSNIIKCKKCGLTQLDPMLTQNETAKGCYAYYIEELGLIDKKESKNLYNTYCD